MVDEKETTTPAEAPAGGGEEADHGNGTSPAGAAVKKKRGADSSWRTSKDEASSGEESDEGDGEGGETGSGEFQRADAETLSKRRIVKARRPFGGAEDQEAAEAPAVANPFANVSLTAPNASSAAEAPAPAAAPPKPSGGGGVFGSKFGHVNAASILAGRAPTGFGGGFGSATTTAAWPAAAGAAAAPAASTATEGGEPPQQEGSIMRPGTGPGLGSAPFGFASYKLNPFATGAAGAGSSGGGGFASSPSKRKPPSELVKGMGGGDEEAGGGEEEGAEEDVEAEPVNATYLVPKVVPGLKDASYKPVTGEEEEACVLQLRSKLYRLTEVATDSSSASAAAAGGAPRRDWVECGVGQAKILIPQARESGEDASAAARVVMRREPGTSVLINARIKPPVVTAAKHADKALRFTCLDEAGQPSTFLFRFKTQDENESFLQEIERQLTIAADSGAAGAVGKVTAASSD